MNSWPYRPLSDFLVEREGRFKPSDPDIADYKRLEKIDFSGQMHISEKPSKTDMIIIEPGDLVISGINVSKGALSVYEGDEPVTATIHYSSYRFDKNKIDIEFLKRFLKSPAFISELQDQVKGGIKTEIKPKHLLLLKTRIPELNEQQKINHHFDAIENEIAELSNEVNIQSTYLTKLRQAILQEAIEGKLTAGWRKKQEEALAKDAKNAKVSLGELHALRKKDPNYSAEALMEKIKAEKQKLIAEGKINKQKALAPIKPEEVPFELPEGWVWTRLGEVIRISSGDGLLTKDMAKIGEVPVFGGNGINGYHNIFNVKKPTIVIGRVGALCGSIHLTPSKAWVTDNAFITYYNEKFLDQEWLIKVLKYLNLRMRARETAQPVISGQRVYPVIFPLPPLAEQQAIVERVEKLLTIVDELEKQVSERKEQSEQLMQAVLREAFEGKPSIPYNKPLEVNIMSL